MEESESIKDLIQKFIIIANQLMLLGRTFDNADLAHKILRSLIKEWQPKVTTISNQKKKKILALKVVNSFDDKDDQLNEVNI